MNAMCYFKVLYIRTVVLDIGEVVIIYLLLIVFWDDLRNTTGALCEG